MSIGINQNRLQHILVVARKVESLAREKNWSEEKCQDMFSLGFVHDIGYEHATNQQEHSYVGGKILKRLGYKYWQEMYYHGVPECGYTSEELNVLNIADFTVNGEGASVTAEERLQDIGARYGICSVQYTQAYILAKELNLV